LQDLSNTVSIAQEEQIKALGDIASQAREDAKAAADSSRIANKEVVESKAIATGARQEADSFEKRIISATDTAIEAESHLKVALEEATKAEKYASEATAELARIRSPRTFANIAEMVSALKVFKGTEYTFSSVFQDPEAIDLIRLIDGVLRRAEWKMVKPPGGFPAVNIYGKEDGNAVPISLVAGIVISVDSTDVPDPGLHSTDSLSPLARVAAALRRAINSNLSPHNDNQDNVPLEILKGESKTIRIAVGRKP
jgi:hypothetical protein